MEFAPGQSYQAWDECTLVVFDLRCPKAVERLHRERAAWQEHADIEALDGDHFVLVIRPGRVARRSAA